MPKFEKRRKKILLNPGKEIYAKSPKMIISLSPYSLVEKIFPPKALSSKVVDWEEFLSILVPLAILYTEQHGRRSRRRK